MKGSGAPKGGMVAAGSPAGADAAVELLRAGGNAFDAAIGAGFASAVTEPGLSSLAGGGFLLARMATGEASLFDFFVDTPGLGTAAGNGPPPRFEEIEVRFPAAEQRFHCGLGSVAVPGCLTGYLHIHERLGRLALAEVVAPAARLAVKGVILAPRQAEVLALLEPILLRTPAGRRLFAPGGRLPAAGERFATPELGAFLDRLGLAAVRPSADGELAEVLLAVMDVGGGLINAEDLAAYRVVERQPLAVAVQGNTLLTNPSPSFGGSLLAAALTELAQETDPSLAPDDADLTASVVQAMVAVDRQRNAIITAAAGDSLNVSRGTTHVSVADSEGNVASMTVSNGEGSGDLLPGAGIMLNNMLGEDDLHPGGFHAAPPGRRVASMMAPSVLVDAEGRTRLVLGSGGSKRIRSALLQVLVNVTVRNMTPTDAVAAPRLHWDVDHLEAEPGFAPRVLSALRRFGPVNVWPDRNMYFGGVHAVAPGRGAGGDPRRDGAARSA